MRQKLIIFTLLVSSVFALMPVAASANVAGNPQIQVRIGSRHHHHRWDRGRHMGWYNGRRAYYYNYYPNDTRYVRRYYYNNGVRTVRYYYNY